MLYRVDLLFLEFVTSVVKRVELGRQTKFAIMYFLGCYKNLKKIMITVPIKPYVYFKCFIRTTDTWQVIIDDIIFIVKELFTRHVWTTCQTTHLIVY